MKCAIVTLKTMYFGTKIKGRIKESNKIMKINYKS
jgi:hypothetical protein